MRSTIAGMTALSVAGLTVPAGAQDWVRYVDETDLRLVADPAVGAADPEEKDFAWGDVDLDGDVDLVVVRKQPFTTTGRRANVLLLNEGGVLVDRTSTYAAASDVAGDEGFLTPTNDRDVALVDVDLDGWLDIVTAVTLTDNQAKALSHPRVYMNLGEVDGAWQGFRYEAARIPEMHPQAGPRFSSVSAGDLTGDGAPDLYFTDYDSGGEQIFDYDNRLLVNDGTGFFTDETAERLTAEMSGSAFGSAGAIADVNGDGAPDIVKLTTLNAPTHVAITYGAAGAPGTFDAYDPVYQNGPYFVSAGDLNGDGLVDLMITDDGTDRYLLNTGNDAAGRAEFGSYVLPDDNGFGGNSLIADLDGDGLADLIVADVHDDLAGCNGTTVIYRNRGAGDPAYLFEPSGVAIPPAELTGVHDVAALDLNGDGHLDLVLGRCAGLRIWINDPPQVVLFSYPDGVPDLLPPQEPLELAVQIAASGGGAGAPGSARLHVSVNGAPYLEQPMVDLGEGLFAGTLPTAECLDRVSFYLAAELERGVPFTDPPGAPLSAHRAVSASGVTVLVEEDVEGDVSAWSVENDPGLLAGAWEQAEPVGTVYNGDLAAPAEDAGENGTMCFLTQNSLPEEAGAPGASDVDGGPTRLLSPIIDVSGSDARVIYQRWVFSEGGGNHVADALTVDVSNDGGQSWVAVPGQETSATGSQWSESSFFVGDAVEPTDQVRLRFGIADAPNNSITEAAIDELRVERLECGPPCPADVNQDGETDVDDLVAVILAWGTGDPAADVTADGIVNVDDLVAIILAWGAC